jgi:SAM-dependent methyltransferase
VNLYQRLLGTPFVYNRVRPLAVGGIDMSPFYRRVEARDDSVLLDVGCGTGDCLRYLKDFSSYLGVDTDPVAIGFAKSEFGSRPAVEFACRLCDENDLQRLQPTEAMLCGVLHHLDDDYALQLLRMMAQSRRLRRLVTSDIVFLPNERVSNFFARFDRGRFCRRADEYAALAERAGFEVAESAIERCHPYTGLAKYWMMVLKPRSLT